MKEVEEILLGGMFRPSEQNCPIRDGELIESLDKIYDIPNPRLGMRVYVQNTGKEYVIKSLKAKNINGVNVANAAVDEFVEDVNFTTEDKMRLDAGGATNVVWENVINPSNMDNFTTAGTYNITGERTRNNDNLPIANTGSGHTFSARLVVLNSSISGTGIDTDKCVTQIMSFSNRVGGDGNVYIRTGRGASLDNLSWENWATLQTNINVGQVNRLDSFVDNGIYSGVYIYGSLPEVETFVMVVINDYAVAGGDRSVTQFKYAYNTMTGSASFMYRTLKADSWTSWLNISSTRLLGTYTFIGKLKDFPNGVYEFYGDLLRVDNDADNVWVWAGAYATAESPNVYIKLIKQSPQSFVQVIGARGTKSALLNINDETVY